MTSPIAQAGHGGTGEVRLLVYRDAIALWVIAAGLFLLACWATWDTVHKIQANETTLYHSFMPVVFFWLFAVLMVFAGTREAITTLAVDGKNLVLHERRLTTARELRFPVTPQSRPRIEIDYDPENASSYMIQVMKPDGEKITVARHWRLAAAQAVLRRMDEIIDLQAQSRADHI